jgi:NAD+ diphosphatase
MPARLDLGPKPQLGYTGSLLDRAAQLRYDAATVAAMKADPRARFYVLGGESVVLRKASPIHDPAFGSAQAVALAAAFEEAFLGQRDVTPWFAVAIDPAAAEALRGRDDLVVSDLRSIATGAQVAPEHLPPLAEAKALLTWHRRHRFCSNCGNPTRPILAGWRRDCPACGTEHFPRIDPVVIMLPHQGERCLLGRSARFAKGMWSCLAGFVEPGETIEGAVRRETLEEAGIHCGQVTYFASQPWPFPMSLMIGCHAEAVTTQITIDPSELEDARWFGRDEVAAMMLRQHPDGLTATHPIAIAHHIIRAWLDQQG